MDIGGIVIGGSGIEGTVVGDLVLCCDCGIGCNLGPVFFLTPAFPYSFLGRTNGVII